MPDQNYSAAAQILVVDDDPALRASLEDILAISGFGVMSAANGKDALAVLETRTPNLIISDITMHGMDGHALLQAVRERPALSATPFIFLSARFRTGEVPQSTEANVAYVSKPFEIPDLLREIERMLS